MSLLDDICSDLISESVDIANTLRKAKILASSLGLSEFREWVDSELNGYSNEGKAPEYRRIRPVNLGTFSGPFGSGLRNQPLPTYNLPPDVKKLAESLVITDGVGAVKAQAAAAIKSKKLHRKWPQEAVILAREAIQVEGMVLVDVNQPISAYVFAGIIDQVKNRLLDFILGLQGSNVTSEDLERGTVKPELARNLFHIHIHGDHNIVASGETVQQQVSSVQKGDRDSLRRFLRGLDVEDDDLSELEEALSSDPAAPDGHYGPKVQAWLGGMISKAASKAWKVGLDVASKALTDALNGYYGLP